MLQIHIAILKFEFNFSNRELEFSLVETISEFKS